MNIIHFDKPIPQSKERITRKEALKLTGRYAAFTAASMMMILKPALAEEGTVSADRMRNSEAVDV